MAAVVAVSFIDHLPAPVTNLLQIGAAVQWLDKGCFTSSLNGKEKRLCEIGHTTKEGFVSHRFKSICIALGVSLLLWVGIIQGSISLYGLTQPGTDTEKTASIK